MKRGLVLSLSALALVAGSSMAQAQNVRISLNLRYTDPADPSEGGTWYLVANTDSPNGISAISAYINNIDGTAASMRYGNAGAVDTRYGAPGTVTAATLGAILNAGNPYAATIGGAINVVYGQDTANGPIIVDVGQGGTTPGNVAVDPLRNPTWNNSAIIANGTFGGTRPVFATNVGTAMNNTDSNTLTAAQATSPPTLNLDADDALTATPSVRGDSVTLEAAGTGLLRGDANRTGVVNSDDFDLLAFNFGLATGASWGQGDFNDTGSVNSDDFDLLAFNFGNDTNPGPAVAAIPEPTSVALLGLAACGLFMARRRS